MRIPSLIAIGSLSVIGVTAAMLLSDPAVEPGARDRLNREQVNADLQVVGAINPEMTDPDPMGQRTPTWIASPPAVQEGERGYPPGAIAPHRLGAVPLPTRPLGEWAPEDLPQALSEEDVDAFSPDAPLEELIRWYAHPDERFQVAALEAIAGHADDERAWDLLSAAVHDPRPIIRHLALTQVAHLAPGWPDGVLLVLVALDDPDPSLRELASTLYEGLEHQGIVPAR